MGMVMQGFKEFFGLDGLVKVLLLVSVGVGCYLEDGQMVVVLLWCVDEVMYCVKCLGGDCSCWVVVQLVQMVIVVVLLCEVGLIGLDLFECELLVLCCVLWVGDVIYCVGDKFKDIYILCVGFCKFYGYCVEGWEDLIVMQFKGDWFGFDGLVNGYYCCDVIVVDVSELMMVSYEVLLCVGVCNLVLLLQMYVVLLCQSMCECDVVMFMYVLLVDGCVVVFFYCWVDELE